MAPSRRDANFTAHYAGGLTIEEIEHQQAEIDRLNAAFGGRFRIFKGIESDILPDGSLDYPDDVLRRFDFIIGNIHGQFRLDRQAQTERLVRAAFNPFITVILFPAVGSWQNRRIRADAMG